MTAIEVISHNGRPHVRLFSGQLTSLRPGWIVAINGTPRQFFSKSRCEMQETRDALGAAFLFPQKGGIGLPIDKFWKHQAGLEVTEVSYNYDKGDWSCRLIHKTSDCVSAMSKSRGLLRKASYSEQLQFDWEAAGPTPLPEDTDSFRFFRVGSLGRPVDFGLAWSIADQRFYHMTCKEGRWEREKEGFDEKYLLPYSDLIAILRDKGLIE